MTTDASAVALDAMRHAMDEALRGQLSALTALSPRLNEAMSYAVLGDGKRIRPLLTLATAASLGAAAEKAIAPACAVEFIHAYSLIHDDLPAMDNDDLRRGRATVHKAFDEATAILAGDALLTLAFEVIARAPLDAPVRVAMISRLAAAAGAAGMVGGQAIDIAMTGKTMPLADIERLHDAKTGALLAVAVELGALAASASPAQIEHLSTYGRCLGRAFQVVDDLIDVTQTTVTQGKKAGADAALGKNTFPGVLGVDATRRYAMNLCRRAIDALAAANITDGPLHHLARQIVERTR